MSSSPTPTREAIERLGAAIDSAKLSARIRFNGCDPSPGWLGTVRVEIGLRDAAEIRSELSRLTAENEALRAECDALKALVRQAHADLGADCGVTERECECDVCKGE